MSNKGSFIVGVIIVLVIIGMFSSCSDSSSDSKYSKYSGYSKTYNDDYEYRKNVKNIADVYGVTEKEVDRKINAITGGK